MTVTFQYEINEYILGIHYFLHYRRKMIKQYKNIQENNLRHTEQILTNGCLDIHPSVHKISLEGSRGLKGGWRDDSDLDLSLVLEPGVHPSENLCEDILSHSLKSWKSGVELDLAVVFDKKKCHLKCFDVSFYDPNLCPHGVDCVGIYKNQKGFAGFVENMGLEIKLMYPAIIIWER